MKWSDAVVLLGLMVLIGYLCNCFTSCAISRWELPDDTTFGKNNDVGYGWEHRCITLSDNYTIAYWNEDWRVFEY